MLTLINKVLRKRDGATAIEYGLIAALIALAIVGGATLLGNNLNARFNQIAGQVGPGAGG